MAEEQNEYSMSQAAEKLGIRRQAVQQALNRGTLRGRKVGNSWIIDKDDLEAYRPNRMRQESGRRRAAPSTDGA